MNKPLIPIVMCIVLAAAPSFRAQVATLSGDWIGDVTMDNQWQLAMMHVGAAEQSLLLPLASQTFRLNTIDARDGIRFTASRQTVTMTLSGGFEDGILHGGVLQQAGHATGTFSLVRLEEVDVDRYSGSYDAGGGRMITINAWPELSLGPMSRFVIQYADTGTHRISSLFPVSATRFISGGPIARALPVEDEVTFSIDAAGNIKSLELRNIPRATTIRARRLTGLYREEAVTFSQGSVTLAGSLIIPTTKGRHPAVILTHGSGAQLRQHGLLEQSFVRAGFAVLTYDKRGVGASTGDYNSASLANLADDAVAGARLLETRSDIDPKRIGFWGLSQGSRVAPMAAAKYGKAGFVIAASGGGLPIAVQELYDTEDELRINNFPESDIADALAFQSAKYEFMKTGEGWEKYSTLRQRARGRRWYGFGNTDTSGPASASDPFWATGRGIYFPEPSDAIEGLTCPLLFLFGALDSPTGVKANVAALNQMRKKTGHRKFAIRVVPNAGHNLFAAEADWQRSLTEQRLQYADGYPDAIVKWAVNLR